MRINILGGCCYKEEEVITNKEEEEQEQEQEQEQVFEWV